MAFKKLGVASLMAIVAVAAFIAFSPKNESSGRNASTASSPAPPSKDTSPTLNSMPKGNVVAGQYGAVVCPDSKTFDAFDAASLRALSTNPPSPDLAAIWHDSAKPNGCNYIRSGTSLASEGEANNSGDGRPLAIVTATMPDGTTIRGVTLSSMLYSIPEGNFVANEFGAVICPDSKDVENYQNAAKAWFSNNEPNMSAEEFKAAAKSSVERLAKSAGCNYVLPGTPLVSEAGIEGGHGYGANLNLIVTAQMPDGTKIRGVTLPIMITQNQQPTAEGREPPAAPPEVTQEPETQQKPTQTLKGRCVSAVACDSISLIYPAKYKGGVVIVFSQGNRGVFGFAGKSYFDSVEGDTKVMVEAVYSPGGVAHVYQPNGEESTLQKPSGWETHQGACEFFQNLGSLTAVECGQPMWSFRADPGQ